MLSVLGLAGRLRDLALRGGGSLLCLRARCMLRSGVRLL